MKLKIFFSVILVFFSMAAFGQDYPKFRVNASGGLGYFLAEVEKDDPYTSQLKWGKSIETNFHYILENGSGFGLDYKYLFHSAQPTDIIVDIYDGANYAVISQSEKNYIHYTGLSFIGLKWLNNSNNLLLSSNISAGYAFLISDVKRDNELTKMTGKNFGGNLNIGLEYFLTNNFSLGLNTGLFYSNIRKIKIENRYNVNEVLLSENQRINLSNLKLNLSISYYIH